VTRFPRFLAAAAVVAGTTLAVAGAPAMASVPPPPPPNCPSPSTGPTTKLLDDSNVEVYCLSGQGVRYRAYVKCTGTSTIFTGGNEAYNNNIPSFAHCPVNKFVTEGGMQANNSGALFKLKQL